MADAVAAAVPDQNTPEGDYNIERMLKRLILGNGRVMLCGTCMDARCLTARAFGRQQHGRTCGLHRGGRLHPDVLEQRMNRKDQDH